MGGVDKELSIADSKGEETDKMSDCKELLELATPGLYHRNLFRVLGLPVNASPKDVQREQNRRRMQEKLGITSCSSPCGSLALNPPPTDKDVRAAMERLNRPVDRLLDEVFWFWPVNGDHATDASLEAIKEGNVERATDLWTKHAGQHAEGQIAAHNLAVYYHLAALDYEAWLTASDLMEREPKRLMGLWRRPLAHLKERKEKTNEQEHLAELWGRSFAHWKAVLEGEEFWRGVKDRVRELNDVQLTTGLVRRVRGTLPTALLLICAKMAYEAAERSDIASAQRHIKLLREAGFGGGLAEEAIREALKPVRTRIKTAIDSAKGKWTNTPHHGNQYVRDLHEQAKSLLTLVDAILPKDNLTRGGLHDMVAETMLLGQVAFGQKTNDWVESIRLLELAEELAVGDTVRSRLSENTEILRNNVKQGNDWYSAGYWDLPAEIVAHLEAAHEKAKAGDYEGALGILVLLNRDTGVPLRRCVAFCLSQRAWQIAGQGSSEFRNQPTKKMEQFLNVIGRLGSISAPDPQMQSWQLPACPCCGSRFYTSWTHGEFNGQRFWMCSSCSASDDLEREEKKRKLRTIVTEGLEYMLLAAEIDEHDTGLRDDVESLKKTAANIEASIPKTWTLRQKLAAHRVRRVQHSFGMTQADRLCHFCGESPADDSCRITVPVCGDIRSVDLFFGQGIEHHYGDIIVPRCRRCRDEHRELPDRIEKWEEARLAAADEEHFSEATQTIADADKTAHKATTAVAQRTQAVVEAQAAAKQAEASGSKCGQCGADTSRRGHLCHQCDGHLFRLSRWKKVVVLSSVLLGLLAPLSELLLMAWKVGARDSIRLAGVSPLSLWVGAVVSLGGPFVLAIAFKWHQWRERRSVRKARRSELAMRQATAMADAQALVTRAQQSLEEANQTAERAGRALEEARSRLTALQQQAIAEFDRMHPQPTLAVGVKDEDTYLCFPRIETLRGQGWGFGHEVIDNGQKVSDDPVRVVGLVGHKPRQARRTKSKAAAKRTPPTPAGAPPLTAKDCKAPGEWVIEEQRVEEITIEPMKLWHVAFADDFARCAYSDGTSLFCGGRRVGSYDEVPQYDVKISPDGSHFRCVARRGNRWFVVLDGKEWPGGDEVVGVSDNADWSHVWCLARSEKQWSVIRNGVPGASYDEIKPWSSRLAAIDGKLRFYYVARRQNKWCLVVDGCPQDEYDDIMVLDVIPEQNCVIYFARVGTMWFWVTNGTCGEGYDAIGDYRSHHASGRVICTAPKQKKWYLVEDGSAVEALGACVEHSLHLSSDGTRVAYVIKTNDGQRAVVDGKEDRPFEEIEPRSLKFSPDGMRVAYFAKSGGKWCAVVDGVASGEYDKCEYYNLAFSSDSKHVVFIGQQVSPQNQYEVVVDGVTVASSTDLLQCPVFSPEFSQTVVYRRSGTVGSTWMDRIIIDGRECKPYSCIHFSRAGFRPDGSFEYTALQDRQLLRVRHHPRITAVSTGADNQAPPTDTGDGIRCSCGRATHTDVMPGHYWCTWCAMDRGPIPGTSPVGPASTKAQRAAVTPESTPRTSAGRCPKCGFTYKWDGSSCGHCGYGQR